MMSIRGRLFLLAGAAVLSGCAPKAETPEAAEQRMTAEAASARTAIEASNAKFMAYFNAMQGDSLSMLYAEDGRMLPPNMAAIAGRAGMAQMITGMGAMKPTLKITTGSVVANGPIAIEAGTYQLSMTPPGAGAAMTDTGKYLVHWHQVNGQWMMMDDIWNSDLPAMPEPPAKKP